MRLNNNPRTQRGKIFIQYVFFFSLFFFFSFWRGSLLNLVSCPCDMALSARLASHSCIDLLLTYVIMFGGLSCLSVFYGHFSSSNLPLLPISSLSLSHSPPLSLISLLFCKRQSLLSCIAMHNTCVPSNYIAAQYGINNKNDTAPSRVRPAGSFFGGGRCVQMPLTMRARMPHSLSRRPMTIYSTGGIITMTARASIITGYFRPFNGGPSAPSSEARTTAAAAAAALQGDGHSAMYTHI